MTEIDLSDYEREVLSRFSGSDRDLIACTASAYMGGKVCRWCNGDLPIRRTRWCSDECANQYGRNHWWTSARHAAVKRDESKCVRCGTRGVDYGVGERGLQVHHTTPILGRHAESGCHHHLDGLETLCVECHHAEHHGIPVEQLAFEAVA